MAKLITKFKYMKPDSYVSAGGYAKYIATREGVEKIDDTKKLLPSTKKQQQLIESIIRDFPDTEDMLEYEDYIKNPTRENATEFITRALEDNADEDINCKTYADYIATRPRVEKYGSHGLFSDAGMVINLKEVSAQMNMHQGNIWTAIISLRREDAEKLGFNKGERWRDMLRGQAEIISNNFKIPMDKFHWYAAFHNESHHPHVHMIMYSESLERGYLTRKGLMRIRSSVAKGIFGQEIYYLSEQQTVHRDKLRKDSKALIGQIISRINKGTYDNSKLEEMLLKLADRLSKTSGKKVYGYLKPDVKAIINNIVIELSKDERIAKLYNLWYEQKENILRIYTNEIPDRIPLVDNKEFKSIKNAVIQEAMNILLDRQSVIDDEPEEDIPADFEIDEGIYMPEPTEQDTYTAEDFMKNPRTNWWTEEYKHARFFLYGNKENKPDFEKAFKLMLSEAENGNGFAMHDIAKMYLSGLGCDADETAANYWFLKAYNSFITEESIAKRKDYLQYRIGKLYSFGYGVEQDYPKAAEWYEKSVAYNNPFASYSLGSLYYRGQGIEKDEEKAYKLFRMAAENKSKPNSYAAYELGKMCEDGIGTDKDSYASKNWYRQAYMGFLQIEQTMADDKLYYRLGQMNLNGLGTEMDFSEAEKYFLKSAELENTDALYGLGKLYLRKDFEGYNPNKAVEYLIKAAQKNHVFAQYTLGKLLLKGDEVPKSAEYALRWLEEAVKNENEYAEYLLGKTLLLGEDVEQDSERAEELLKKSADKGNKYAKYILGKSYIEGILLLQDIPEGLRLITESADEGFAGAQYYLGKILYKGEIVKQDIENAIYYLEKAADSENEFAAYFAGKILLNEPSLKDIKKTIKYFEIAAKNGNSYAEYQLGKLYIFGKEIEKDYNIGMEYLKSSAEKGNQYAEQLIHSIENNRDWSASIGIINLLYHLSRTLRNKTEDNKGKYSGIDRKLKRKIDEKKQAQGLRL